MRQKKLLILCSTFVIPFVTVKLSINMDTHIIWIIKIQNNLCELFTQPYIRSFMFLHYPDRYFRSLFNYQ